MPNNVTLLTESFNQSAQNYSDGIVPAQLLAQKYAALLQYKAETPEEKSAIVDAMFTIAEKHLKKLAGPEGSVDASSRNFPAEVQPLLEALKSEESLVYLPERAAQSLANLTIALVDRVGVAATTTEFNKQDVHTVYISQYRTQMIELTKMLVSYADLFGNALKGRTPSTFQPETGAAKPSSLKLKQ